MPWMLLLFACQNDAPPLGMILEHDGVVYAGAASIDITPVITDLFDDVDGDHIFSGCMDDPDAEVCREGFEDVDGDGWFDAVWIGGFSPLRPALEVHDPVYARAVVISQDGEYIAFVALDLVGLGSPRIYDAKHRLGASGFNGERLIVASSHNHQGPDTMGLWGNPFNFSDPVSGTHPAYQNLVSYAIEYAVREAALAMEPVTLSVGTEWMRDRTPYFNGAAFGGRNPDHKMHGMIHDGRDPVVVSDQLLVLQGNGESGTVFTLTNWSGHPEVRGSENNAISSDWVGVTREVLEAEYGGLALHLPECLGGMMSALNGDLPLVLDDGTHVHQTCSADDAANVDDSECYGLAEGDDRIDEDGLNVPVWAERNSWEFVTSHGWHIAEAAIDALTAGETIDAAPLRVELENYYIPIENYAYNLLGPTGIFDLGLDDAVTDTALCPEAGDTEMGCLETTTMRLQLGPIGFVTVPGELLPELAWGFPDSDPQWVLEAADPTARGAGATYFPQHDADCNTLDYADCQDTDEIGECECLEVHAWPYTLSHDETVPPLLDMLDTEYRAVIGAADNYMSYIVPEPDFNRDVTLLSPTDGDHYEDTVSPTSLFGTKIQEAQLRISDRW